MGILTYNDVAKVLKADFESGKLFWLPRTPDMFSSLTRDAQHNCAAWNARWANKEAFTHLHEEYFRGAIFCKKYFAHQIIWLLAHKEWAKNEIDHINGIKTDNRIENLRDVIHQENSKNQKMSSANTSGKAGVYWFKQTQKWHAQIKVNKKNKHLGFFDDFNDACLARKRAEIKYGYHKNHGC